MRILNRFLPILAVLLAVHAIAAEGERYALIVGVSDYRRDSGLNKLKYAESDAQKLAKTLEAQGFKARNIHLMVQNAAGDDTMKPRRDNIEKQLKILMDNKEPEDLVLV